MSDEQIFKFKLIVGDTLTSLRDFDDNTFHCAITSPPYWDQRDYGEKEQLGQEETPEEYVANLVAISEEVRRTLRKDGTFWLNIGDGYCKKAIKGSSLKPQDLLGIPWMVAFAMRDAGWYLRCDVIWQKTNPMPESVKNRPSKSYEHLFLFSKNKKYFYDYEAIKEPQKEISIRRAYSKNRVKKRKDYQDDNYAISGKSQDKTYEKMRKIIDDLKEGLSDDEKLSDHIKRNKRDIWEVATANSKIKHFAIYPIDLIKPCLMAGTSSGGCCSQCKTPWVRKKSNILEWESGCDCLDGLAQECLVLDPFNGTGTTGHVCKHYHRKYVGIDISSKYISYTREALGGDDYAKFQREVNSIAEIVE